MFKLIVPVMFVILGSACTQAEGNSCFVNKDCEEGLVCCVQNLLNEQGKCVPPNECITDTAGNDSDTINDGNTDSQ
ncbi:hypothetical protein KKF34_11635 [Myxococcota bacterium]|nr:hypothetical protein [Myxococcota bacterium]MBU1381508.1 hypothetical protein [Myxococcota bacterium]MBU1497515.1 hypothetical protein [Myxococcota bacterium]